MKREQPVAPPVFAPRLPATAERGNVRDWEVNQYNQLQTKGLGQQLVGGMNVNYLDAPAGTVNYSGAQLTTLTGGR